MDKSFICGICAFILFIAFCAGCGVLTAKYNCELDHIFSKFFSKSGGDFCPHCGECYYVFCPVCGRSFSNFPSFCPGCGHKFD